MSIKGLYEAVKNVAQAADKEASSEKLDEIAYDNSDVDAAARKKQTVARLDYQKLKKTMDGEKDEATLKGNGYAPHPKAVGERRFAAKHLSNVVRREDPAGNGDDVFKASNVKAVDREAENHGYNPGDDEDIYEEAIGRHLPDLHQKNDKGGVRVYYAHNYNEYRIVPYTNKNGKEVRSKENSWGYTDDKQDAEDTAKDMHKRLHEGVVDKIRYKSLRRTIDRMEDKMIDKDEIAPKKVRDKYNRLYTRARKLEAKIDEGLDSVDRAKYHYLGKNGPRKNIKNWLQNKKNRKNPKYDSVLGGYASRKDHPNKNNIFAEEVESLDEKTSSQIKSQRAKIQFKLQTQSNARDAKIDDHQQRGFGGYNMKTKKFEMPGKYSPSTHNRLEQRHEDAKNDLLRYAVDNNGPEWDPKEMMRMADKIQSTHKDLHDYLETTKAHSDEYSSLARRGDTLRARAKRAGVHVDVKGVDESVEGPEEERGNKGKIPRKRGGILKALDVTRQRNRISSKLQDKLNRKRRVVRGLKANRDMEIEYQAARQSAIDYHNRLAGAALAHGYTTKAADHVDAIKHYKGAIAKSQRKVEFMGRRSDRAKKAIKNTLDRAKRVGRKMRNEEMLSDILAGNSATIQFEDGNFYLVSEQDAMLFSNLFKTLDEDNQEIFGEMLLGSKETYDEVRDFVINNKLGVEDDYAEEDDGEE